MKMSLGNSWAKRLENRIGRYEFEVGVLEDAPHYEAVEAEPFGQPQLKTYAGGPARKQTRKASGQTVGQVLVENMQRLNVNLLSAPFQKQSSEIMQFTKAFLESVTYKPAATLKRVENLLQAVVRNPILRQEYGPNRAATADAKGFDRHLIDTAQMFKAIRARAKRV